MIRRTRAGPKAMPQSASSKRNSPWSNFPTGWGCPTLVPSTSGRNDGWLGFWRRSIDSLSQDITVWISWKMDPCTGRWQLRICWRLSRTGCHWKILIKPNGISDSGWRWFRRHVQVRFGRRGRREARATSDRRQFWESVGAKKREVKSQSCQGQLWWLWFIECRMTTMTRHWSSNSKLHTQMWGIGKSRLISSKKIVTQQNNTLWLPYTNATWHRKNWMGSIWDHTHRGKSWMTLHMVRFHTTVPFLMHSSWNWDTM